MSRFADIEEHTEAELRADSAMTAALRYQVLDISGSSGHQSMFKEKTHAVLCIRLSLIGCLAIPNCRLGVIRGDSSPW